MTSLQIPREVARHFGWLEELGYKPVKVSRYWGYSVTYERDGLLVMPYYAERDEIVDVLIAKRTADDLGEQPYWSYVHLYEILARRAPGLDIAKTFRATGSKEAERKLGKAADILKTHAGDLLHGDNLELLDSIIDTRPRYGVPGLDFPVAEPIAMTPTGFLMATDSKLPLTMQECLLRASSPDATTRAVAALKIVHARGTEDRSLLNAGHQRLHELLQDPEAVVRRAAASALGEWLDADALEDLLRLLDDEPGDSISPVAWAAHFIALNKGDRLAKQRTNDALHRFAAKGAVALQQARALRQP